MSSQTPANATAVARARTGGSRAAKRVRLPWTAPVCSSVGTAIVSTPPPFVFCVLSSGPAPQRLFRGLIAVSQGRVLFRSPPRAGAARPVQQTIAGEPLCRSVLPCRRTRQRWSTRYTRPEHWIACARPGGALYSAALGGHVLPCCPQQQSLHLTATPARRSTCFANTRLSKN